MTEKLYRMLDGVKIELTPEETSETLRLQNEVAQEAAKNQWLEGRIREYPPITEQLDILYHEGIEGWHTVIKNIKEKYPKPINNNNGE